jgi:hypothetical protein
MILENALNRSDEVVLIALLHTMPPLASTKVKEERIASCLAVWNRFSHVFRNPNFRIGLHEYDYANLEALKRLPFVTSEIPAIRAIIRMKFISPSDSNADDATWGVYSSIPGGRSSISLINHLPTSKSVVAMYSDEQGRLGVCFYDESQWSHEARSTKVRVYDVNGAEQQQFRMDIKGAADTHRLCFDSGRVCCAYFTLSRLKAQLTVSIREISTGALRHMQLPPRYDDTCGVEFSSDRRYILTRSLCTFQGFSIETDSDVENWTAETMLKGGGVHPHNPGPVKSYNQIAFSSDGNLAAVLTLLRDASTVTIVDLKHGSLVRRINFKGQRPWNLVFLPGTRNLYGLTDMEAQLIWRPAMAALPTAQFARAFKSIPGRIGCRDHWAFRHNRRIIVASPSGLIRLFKFSDGILRCEAILVNKPLTG